jgi:hypothetical protein
MASTSQNQLVYLHLTIRTRRRPVSLGLGSGGFVEGFRLARNQGCCSFLLAKVAVARLTVETQILQFFDTSLCSHDSYL